MTRIAFSTQDFDRFLQHAEPPDDLQCIISRRLVVRPALNPQWPQHVFERRLLKRWLRTNSTDPVSRTPLSEATLEHDARRAREAAMFRRQLVAHCRARAEVPDLPDDVAQQGRAQAAALTIQRAWLQHTGGGYSPARLYNRLLAAVGIALREARLLRESLRAVQIERTLDADVTYRDYTQASKAFSELILRCEQLVDLQRRLHAMSADTRSHLFTFDAVDWDEQRLQRYIEETLRTPETAFLDRCPRNSTRPQTRRRTDSEDLEAEARRLRSQIDREMRLELDSFDTMSRTTSSTSEDSRDDQPIGVAALEFAERHAASRRAESTEVESDEPIGLAALEYDGRSG